MKFQLTAALALGMAMTGATLKADDAKKAPAWYEKTTVSGFVDAYYQLNMNGRSAPATVGNRAFDLQQQQFQLSGAKLAIANSDAASKTGGELDLFYGPTAKLFNTTSANESLAVEQGYVTQGMGDFTLKVGKFTTFVGTEVIETPANMNYSRGTLFGAIPFYHVGAELTYGMEGMPIMIYTGNGNSVDTASNEYRDYGLSLGFTKVKGMSLSLIYYMEAVTTDSFGSANTGGMKENQHYFDFLASYQIAESLGFSGEYLYKTHIASKDTDPAGNLTSSSVMTDPSTGKLVAYSPKQQGYALYLNYSTPMAGLSILPRFEQWYTPEGLGALTTDTTLTVKYASGPLTHYLEYRNDWKSDGGFAQAGGNSVTKSSQDTLTYGATYSF